MAAGDEDHARRELAAWVTGSATPGLDGLELRRTHPELVPLLP